MQWQWTISWSDFELRGKMDFIHQPVMTSSVVGPRRISKALPKGKISPKEKVMVTVWWFAVCLICYSFLNSGEIITSKKYAQQINKNHWKLQGLKLDLVNRMGPILLHDYALPHVAQPTLQKWIKLGYEVLPHLPYSPDLSPSNYHFFNHLEKFLQGKYFHNQQEAENAFQ